MLHSETQTYNMYSCESKIAIVVIYSFNPPTSGRLCNKTEWRGIIPGRASQVRSCQQQRQEVNEVSQDLSSKEYSHMSLKH